MIRLNRWLLCGLLSPGVLFATTGNGFSQDLGKVSSLKLVPKDADAYMGNFRLSESWDAIGKGPVVQKLLSLPVVKENWQVFQEQWKKREGQVATLRVSLENPNVKDALQFLKELTSDESFFFIDKNGSPMLRSIGELNDQIADLMNSDQSQERLQAVIGEWVTQSKGLSVPTFVMGAKCDDEDLSLTKVDQLEALIRLGTQFNPNVSEFANLIKRVDDDRGSRLTIELKGDMIPWEEIPITDENEKLLDNLQQGLENRTVAITIGTLDKFFLFAISEKSKDILGLGKADSLASHPDLAPAFQSKKNLSSITYVSDAFAQANFEANSKNVLSRNFSAALKQLKDSEDADESMQKFVDEIRKESIWLDGELAKLAPQIKGQTDFSYLTETGWEYWSHLRSKNIMLDGSKPLASLQHTGGDPLLFVATRLQDHPEYYELFKTVVVHAKGLFDKFVDGDFRGMDGKQELKEVQTIVNDVFPILVKLSNAWEKGIAPSFDGEHGIVLSAGNLKAKQWAKEMPPSDIPLPIPEFATITKLRDKSKFKQGFVEVLDGLDELLGYVRSKEPSFLAGFEIPRPQEQTSSVGEKFVFPIPEDCPVPKSLTPQALFTDEFLICSYSEEQAASIAKTSSTKIAPAVIDASKNLANATYLHVGKIMSVGRPWLEYGLKQGVKDLNASMNNSPEPFLQAYTFTANDVLSLWSVLESIGYSSNTITIGKDGTSVSRSVYTHSGR